MAQITTTLLPLSLSVTPQPLSAADNASIASLHAAIDGIYDSYIWIVFILGFPGNVACVVTVLSMTKLSTATLYVALLAITDSVALLIKLIVHQVKWHGHPLTAYGCKASFLAGAIACYSNWTLVLVCFERFLAVCLPLKKAVYFTKRRAIMVASVLLVIVLAVHIPGMVFHTSNKNGWLCGYDTEEFPWVNEWYWVSTLLYSFFPFVLIVVFATLIIVGLRKYRAARKSILGNPHSHNGAKGDKRGDSSNVERAISIMLVVAAVVFLVLTLPTCIYFIAHDFNHMYRPVQRAQWELFDQVARLLADLTHAVNFYLYFISADKFRSQFRELVTCGRRKDRKKSDVTSLAVTQYSIANSTENIQLAASRV